MTHFGLNLPGTFAELFVARADRVRRIPDDVPFTAAALAEPVCVCLEALHQANLTPGGHLLIVGDGPFGLLMARLAPRLGIDRVTVSGHHPGRLAHAGSAATVAVPRGADAREPLREASGGKGYDAIILAVSRKEMVNACLDLLRPTGRLVIFAPMPGGTDVDLFQVLLRELEIVGAVNDRDRFDEAIAALADPAVGVGDLVTHSFALDDFAEAFRVAEFDRQHALKVAFVFD
jgi:threonine dehydrogenase-like Zn-dependent dehydrogenase